MKRNSEAHDLRTQVRWRVYRSGDHVPGSAIVPWNLELRGPKGSAIYPWGGEWLCAYTSRSGHRERLRKLGQVVQEGDRETVIRFQVDKLDEVAATLHCYRRPRLTPEQREASRLRLERMRMRAVGPDNLGHTDSRRDDRVPGRGKGRVGE